MTLLGAPVGGMIQCLCAVVRSDVVLCASTTQHMWEVIIAGLSSGRLFNVRQLSYRRVYCQKYVDIVKNSIPGTTQQHPSRFRVQTIQFEYLGTTMLPIDWSRSPRQFNLREQDSRLQSLLLLFAFVTCGHGRLVSHAGWTKQGHKKMSSSNLTGYKDSTTKPTEANKTSSSPPPPQQQQPRPTAMSTSNEKRLNFTFVVRACSSSRTAACQLPSSLQNCSSTLPKEQSVVSEQCMHAVVS